jgi:truncated hemoglobin YjbI
MSEINFKELTDYAKAFSALTASREACLIEIGAEIKPRLNEVTEAFYDTLQQIPKAHPLLKGRIDTLKKTHRQWLEGLFTGPFDESFAEAMYRVGDVHVKVKLPVEFMAGGMTLINNQLIRLIVEFYGDNPEKCREALGSVTAVLGFCLILMQQSFQASTLVEELDKFMKITGISQKLFNNLAAAYSTDPIERMKLIA